jgi:hypothetical protein
MRLLKPSIHRETLAAPSPVESRAGEGLGVTEGAQTDRRFDLGDERAAPALHDMHLALGKTDAKQERADLLGVRVFDAQLPQPKA